VQPWQGKSIFIWELSACEQGTLQAIAQQAASAKLDSVIVKAHDGAGWWSQFTSELVSTLHAHSIKVGAWGYCYGHDVPGEAEQACQALSLGADFYVADVEVEFEGMFSDVAANLMQRIRAGASGKPIGFTSFGLPADHPSFPWQTFAANSDFMLPQVYWVDWGMPAQQAVRMSNEQCGKYGVPVVPVGQAYGAVGSYAIDQFAASASGASGISFWSWQHATADMWLGIAQATTTRGVIVTLQYGNSGEAVKSLQIDLNKVLGIHIAEDGQYGPATDAAVKSLQVIAHLTVDGIAGEATYAVLDEKLKAMQKSVVAPAPVAKVPITQPTETDKVKQALALLAQASDVIASMGGTIAPSSSVIATVPIDVLNDAVYFLCDGIGRLQLDTGDFKLCLAGDYAKAANLPNLGALTIQGVGGTAHAYNSKVTFKLGETTYTDVPCVVDEAMQMGTSNGLFGLDFLNANGISITLDPVAKTLTFSK